MYSLKYTLLMPNYVNIYIYIYIYTLIEILFSKTNTGFIIIDNNWSLTANFYRTEEDWLTHHRKWTDKIFPWEKLIHRHAVSRKPKQHHPMAIEERTVEKKMEAGSSSTWLSGSSSSNNRGIFFRVPKWTLLVQLFFSSFINVYAGILLGHQLVEIWYSHERTQIHMYRTICQNKEDKRIESQNVLEASSLKAARGHVASPPPAINCSWHVARFLLQTRAFEGQEGSLEWRTSRFSWARQTTTPIYVVYCVIASPMTIYSEGKRQLMYQIQGCKYLWHNQIYGGLHAMY